MQGTNTIFEQSHVLYRKNQGVTDLSFRLYSVWSNPIRGPYLTVLKSRLKLRQFRIKRKAIADSVLKRNINTTSTFYLPPHRNIFVFVNRWISHLSQIIQCLNGSCLALQMLQVLFLFQFNSRNSNMRILNTESRSLPIHSQIFQIVQISQFEYNYHFSRCVLVR